MYVNSSKSPLVAGLFFVILPLSSYGGDLDGIWTGTATSTSGSVGGVTCSNSAVNVLVDGSQIRGTALTGAPDVLRVSGTLKPDGSVADGSFATSTTNVASFTGAFSATSASGSWNDRFGCSGIFNLNLAASYVRGFDELWRGTAVPLAGGGLCGTADLIFALRDSSITGSVETSHNEVFLGTGSLGSGDAIVGGKFRIGSLNMGGFSGSMNRTTGSGSGNWSDTAGCAGPFSMSRIASANTPPIANDSSITVTQNSTLSGKLSGSDADAGDVLSFSIVSQGSKGSAAVTNFTTGEFVYTPNTGAIGTDTFRFKVNDGKVDSNVATVSVDIELDPGVVLPILNTILLDSE